MISHPVPQGMSKYWQKKSVGTVSSPVPQLKGLRIAHHRRTSNAEAHANMYNISSPYVYMTHGRQIHTYPQASTVASFLTMIYRSCEVLSCQESSV